MGDITQFPKPRKIHIETGKVDPKASADLTNVGFLHKAIAANAIRTRGSEVRRIVDDYAEAETKIRRRMEKCLKKAEILPASKLLQQQQVKTNSIFLKPFIDAFRDVINFKLKGTTGFSREEQNFIGKIVERLDESFSEGKISSINAQTIEQIIAEEKKGYEVAKTASEIQKEDAENQKGSAGYEIAKCGAFLKQTLHECVHYSHQIVQGI